MNDRLIGELLNAAALAPQGMRGVALVGLVAEHCAKICDALYEGGVENDAQAAAETIRAAFVGHPELTPVAAAAKQ